MEQGTMEKKPAEKKPAKLRAIVRKAGEKAAEFLKGFPQKDPLVEIRPPF